MISYTLPPFVVSFLGWAYNSWVGEITRNVPWVFSVCETLHFIGLSILFAALLVMDLRLLGFLPQISIKTALKMIPVAIVGFVINLLTGIVFFASSPGSYAYNPAFLLKMALILVAGANAILHEYVFRQRFARHGHTDDVDTLTKVIAGSSLFLWTAILLLGRLLPQFSIDG